MISKFFINRPIVAIVIAIVTVIGGLVAMVGPCRPGDRQRRARLQLGSGYSGA